MVVASVARNGETLRLATRKPFTNPTTSPSPIAATNITGTILLSVAAKPVAMTAEVAITEATDRSTPPTSKHEGLPEHDDAEGRRLGENIGDVLRLQERRRKDRHDEGVGNQKAEQPIFAQELAGRERARRAVRRQLAGDRLAHARLPFST